MDARPGGPTAKRQPSPEGLGIQIPKDDVSAVGAALNLGPLMSSRAYPDFLLHRSHRCHLCGSPQSEPHAAFEAATLDRKSGEADLSRLPGRAVEGSAVPRTFPGRWHVRSHIASSPGEPALICTAVGAALFPCRYPNLISGYPVAAQPYPIINPAN